MNRARLENALLAIWYGGARVPATLRLLAVVFALVSGLRRLAYRCGLKRRQHVGVPVVVVGNITVGGSGKTPLVIELVTRLRKTGARVGIVARGYGGNAQRWPQWVTPDSDARQVGDEPVLLAQATGCTVVAGPNRVAAARMIASQVDVIIADDGLQHYGLAREIEIVVVDGVRGLGNRRLLPAGPLREPARRLRTVDAIVIKTGAGEADDTACDLPSIAALNPIRMRVQSGTAYALGHDVTQPLSYFSAAPVHAVAGIGRPASFFQALRSAGLDVHEHPLPDHAELRIEQVQFDDDWPVLMTEKDAVKCRQWPVEHRPRIWVVAAHVQFDEAAIAPLFERIRDQLGVS